MRLTVGRIKYYMKCHPCSIPMLWGLLEGTVTMRWVHRSIVGWPADVLSNHAGPR